MTNSAIRTRLTLTIVGAATTASLISREARATAECENPLPFYDIAATFAPADTWANPTFNTCYPFFLDEGPGTGLLAQDQSSSSISGTYALIATSINNTAIYSTGYSYGVYALGTSGYGVYGVGDSGGSGAVTPSGAHYYGVYGTSAGDDGVSGQVDSSYNGVSGINSGSGKGVYGESTSGTGVYGESDATSGAYYGVHGVASITDTAAGGVYGYAYAGGIFEGPGAGVYGNSWNSGGYGLYGNYTGDSQNSSGSNNGYAIYANDTSTGGGSYGVYAVSDHGIGIEGVSDNSTGVVGAAANASYNGVYGSNSAAGNGVAGSATGNGAHGLYGTCSTSSGDSCDGVYGTCSGSAGCYAGYFNGPTYVNGLLTVYEGSVNLSNGYVYEVNGTCVAGCSSDERLKKDIVPMSGAMDDLLKLRGVTFEWKDPKAQGNREEGLRRGFIAQDVEKVFPQWVDEDKNGMKHLLIRQNEIEAMEVESIRTLKMQNDSLSERLRELERGRRPTVSGFDVNGLGFGVGGLGVAVGGLAFARRKREDAKSA